MYKETIGIVGGFGAWATHDFYRRLIIAFSGKTERELPHLIMENDFTMPSRTKALLYGEDKEQVIAMMAESFRKLCLMDVDYILMVCGTAHAFLPDVLKRCPEAESKIINIIEILGEYLRKSDINHVLVIAAEGTLKNKVYPRYLNGIRCISPSEQEFGTIRKYIELVKQNQLEESDILSFERFIRKYKVENVVLGCTEFPVLVEQCAAVYPQIWDGISFWDPLQCVIEKLKLIMK